MLTKSRQLRDIRFIITGIEINDGNRSINSPIRQAIFEMAIDELRAASAIIGPCLRHCGFNGSAQAVVDRRRSVEHTSELQSLMRISYAVFCLKKNNIKYKINYINRH